MSKSDANERRVIIPVEYDGEVYDALLDTGASKSFIDRAIVDKAQLRINGALGKIRLGDKDHSVNRAGETDPIEIRCNEHSILAAFE
ncbi:hypothetical protein BGZ75_001883, partial [Mortierella antarctica]